MAWVDPPTWDADDPWLHTDANQYVTDNTEYLYGQLSNAFVLNEMSASQVTVNTDSWTNVMRFAMEGGELAGANGYRISIAFSFANSVGVGRNFQARLTYGGTTIATVTVDNLSSPVTAHGIIDALLWETAENTQAGVLKVAYQTATPGGDPDYPVAADGGVGTVDSSDAHNLDVDVKNVAASGSLTFTMLFYHVHKLTAA